MGVAPEAVGARLEILQAGKEEYDRLKQELSTPSVPTAQAKYPSSSSMNA